MSRIHRFPDAARAEQEACEWVARLHADDVTAEDRAQFEAWVAKHPLHARAYQAVCGTVDEVKRAGRIVRAVSFGNAMSAASEGATVDIPGSTVAGTSPGRRFISAGWGIAAAAALSAVAVALVWWKAQTGPETSFQTAIGEHASVELPDGSRLDLNSNSLARVQFSARARMIRLARGEAFFKVAHDPQRPFWVVAGQSWIRAVGTAFNVDLRPTGVRVLVSEGTVKVTGAHESGELPSDGSLAKAPVSVLTAGQQVEIRSGAAAIRSVEPTEMTRVAAWRNGKLYFENQSLESVLEELSRYTESRLVIDDESLRQLPVGGTFQANPQGVEALLGMLREGLGLRIRREGDGRIHIEEPAQER